MRNLLKKIFPNIETKIRKQVITELYSNPKALIEIELTNKSKKLKYIWCEPLALQIELEEDYDYKIVTLDRSFGLEFIDEDEVVFWQNYNFGFKLYKSKKGKGKWILDEDYSGSFSTIISS